MLNDALAILEGLWNCLLADLRALWDVLMGSVGCDCGCD